MTRDMLDDLLDRSAPATRKADPDGIRAMIADAQAEGRPRRERRRRTVLVAGALTLLLAGGAGAAAATDGFSWAPWAQDPVGAVPFTMNNGLECELRWSGYSDGPDPAFLAGVNRTLKEWHRSTDVVGAAERRVPAVIAELGDEILALEPGQTLADLPEEEALHRRWVQEWTAWDMAVTALEGEALTSAGIDPTDERFVGSTRSGQIQCQGEDGSPYVPGAGS